MGVRVAAQRPGYGLVFQQACLGRGKRRLSTVWQILIFLRG